MSENDLEFQYWKIRRLVRLALIIWIVFFGICILASLAGAGCVQMYLNGRATNVCSSASDTPRGMAPGYQDLADQTEHNRQQWKRLMRIKPGSANFNQQVLDAMEGNDEADEE